MKKDESGKVKRYRKAAELGDVAAQCRLDACCGKARRAAPPRKNASGT